MLDVTAVQIAQAYARNEVGADEKFRGKRVRINGTADKIAKTADDTPFVEFRGAGDVGVECVFNDGTAQPDLGKLRAGWWAKVEGTGAGLTLGVAVLTNCTLLEYQTGTR